MLCVCVYAREYVLLQPKITENKDGCGLRDPLLYNDLVRRSMCEADDNYEPH